MKKTFERAPECAFREIDGEAFVVNPKTAGAHLLNKVGTYIWSLLDGNKTCGEIIAAVTDEFDADAGAARADVETFVEKLAAARLIIEQG